MSRLRTKRSAPFCTARILGALGVALSAGCVSQQSQRMDPWRPSIAARERTPWAFGAEKPSRKGAKPDAGKPVKPEAVGESSAGATPPPAAAANGSSRILKHGDKVSVSLMAIPDPAEIAEVVDEDGAITLPHLGTMQIAGLTTSEAEKLVERAYIEGRYYRRINVIVVADLNVYFVRGEVKAPGRYDLEGDVTLMMAINTAHGFTDFANWRKISIIRGDRTIQCNAERIEAHKDEDPLIEPRDKIVVKRAIVGLWGL